MKHQFTLIMLALITLNVFAQATQDPGKARLIFDDVKLFWKAYDKDYPTIQSSTLRTDYIERISKPLQKAYVSFIVGQDGKELETSINNNLAYFDNLKRVPFDTVLVKKHIRQGYSKLRRLYKPAKFPDVYFAVGHFASAGAFMNGDLAISLELFPDTMQVVNNKTTSSYALLPAVVLHEIVHFQQNYIPANTLLAKCIKEGAADFITELVYGSHPNRHIHTQVNPNEKAIWREFQSKMNGVELHNWLYTHDPGRIKDLGCYLGYKIIQSYYNQKSDKKQAIIDILNIRDYEQFLVDSKYDDKF